jgi:hypothetical protein
MVAVVQLVEHQVVILAVAGSSPVSHPDRSGSFGSLTIISFATRLSPLEAAQDVWALWITGLERDDNIRSRCWRDGCILPSARYHDRRPNGIVGVDDRHSDHYTSESQRVVTAGHSGGVDTKVSVIIHDIHHRFAQSTGLGALRRNVFPWRQGLIDAAVAICDFDPL